MKTVNKNKLLAYINDCFKTIEDTKKIVSYIEMPEILFDIIKKELGDRRYLWTADIVIDNNLVNIFKLEAADGYIKNFIFKEKNNE